MAHTELDHCAVMVSACEAGKNRCTGRRFFAVALAAILPACVPSSALCAADYAREARLAQEVVPAIVAGDAVYLATARQPRVLAIYTEPSPPAIAKAAVIVVHGLGVDPDRGMINGLRTGLAEAGMATLSVQMPVLAADASREEYASLFPEANERFAAAIVYLRARGAGRIAIVSHSMGSSMADAYLASSSAARIVAWVPIGMTNALDSHREVPVLDVTAEHDMPQVLDAASKRVATLPHDGCSKHISIAGTDHAMEDRQRELVAAIVPFLVRAFAGRC
jgi:pimeloyl-ACP methyl ester carboxylesterase